tara:strand:+ start:6701 stop:7024 length:324 start_codon:yes stop_codon:yes gene_type:complete
LNTRSSNDSIAIAWFQENEVDFHQWSNKPNTAYEWHEHKYHKVLFCIKGSINFFINDDVYTLSAGDRLDLPNSTLHKAVVLEHGVTCIEGAVTSFKNSVLQITKFIE